MQFFPEEVINLKKRLIMQISLVVLLIVISIFLYRIGKGFQLIVENKNFTLGDVVYEAEGPVRVTFDDEIRLDLKKNSADLAILAGYGKHKIKVEVLDNNGNTIRTVEKTFSLSGKEGDLVSIPSLLNGSERWIFRRNVT